MNPSAPENAPLVAARPRPVAVAVPTEQVVDFPLVASRPPATVAVSVPVAGPVAEPGRRAIVDQLPRARSALDQARRTRAEAQVRVSLGEVTALEVILAAHAAEGVPLRRITLRQLLMSQPGVGPATAANQLESLVSRLPRRQTPRRLTVGWLIDFRVGGRRLLSWLDTTQPKRTPWPGFPAAPRPAAQQATATSKG